MKFLYLFFALCFVAVQLSAAAPKSKSQPRLCQIYCPDVEEPVCAKRGSVKKIFSSPCRLNAANMCGDGEKWTKC
ncbi:U-Kazal-Dg21.2-like [Episyrphus balteatus]|uniref:U-Kazal-Dg21.2-like n=1 Tax=Episyrphus balteatus TaxID=286459 RepID=UPI0024868C65|nr:U-Kazal-Dg21.2-like [Episyrphus balteatus]